ncbi:MAG: hypothetical protein KME21_29925 [Desmonostoc vinosum HA7617-LM4]|nr:hypothetical protein [Desmonostoc vinosum HA7617-LM4]
MKSAELKVLSAEYGKHNGYQDLRKCHKQWRGVTAPRTKELGDKHGNSGTF